MSDWGTSPLIVVGCATLENADVARTSYDLGVHRHPQENKGSMLEKAVDLVARASRCGRDLTGVGLTCHEVLGKQGIDRAMNFVESMRAQR